MERKILGAVTENIGPVGPEYDEPSSAPPPLALLREKTGINSDPELTKKLKYGLIIAVAVAVLILLIMYGPKAVFKGLAWIADESRGKSIFLVGLGLVILQIIWSVLCIPFISIIETLAGFILGFWPGMVVNSIGLLLGCVTSFVIGKRFLRSSLKEWITLNAPKWAATFKVMEREGLQFLIMFRFLALPFWAKNYGPAALLDIPVSRFAISALVATCPFGWLYAFLGDRSKEFTSNASSDAPRTGTDALANFLELLVILIVIIGSIFVSAKAFRMFQQAEAETNAIELATKGQHVLLQEEAGSPVSNEKSNIIAQV